MRKNRHFLTGILLLVIVGLHAQTIEITGKVTDATGAPIPAATIRVKNAKGGTSADFQGNFTIKAAKNAILIISGVGYETREVKVTGPTVEIQLPTDSKSLSEVVVTGTGVATSKRKLGISVESVTADKLPPAPTASIDQAL
ncbi:MAG TPA: carboxypeptidase-like regulatory domain-containing protein, partial [Puia sp.]|nr:carboxypeptidase-like regulatory domain-containing protein [Puia sp.]